MKICSVSVILLSLLLLPGLHGEEVQKREIRSIPTVVTSRTLDVDFAGNKAVLLGNVDVDDPKMHLICQRMELFFAEIPGPDGKKSSRKDLQRIECHQNVRMDRKDQAGPESHLRSVSGKAVYLPLTESVILTEKPVIYRGSRTEIHGSRIILYRNSSRMEVSEGRIVTSELEKKEPEKKTAAAGPPTVITSRTMEMDLDHGKAVLTGNVFIEDPKLHLNCRKMVLFFQEAVGPDGRKLDRKDLQRIECYGEVKMNRRGDSGAATGQRSVSGKAVYLLKNATVTLTEKPVIYNGDLTEVHGSRIILHQEGNRMEVAEGRVTTRETGNGKTQTAGPDPAPTVITSDAIDMENNRVLFLGNVNVSNTKADVTCRRMVLFLKEKTPGQTEENGGRQDLQKIECYDDVVILRKNSGTDLQKALAGKAVYLPEDETVTLTEKPVMHKGDRTRLYGSRIVLHQNTNQMDVMDGKIVTREMRGRNPKQTGKADAEEKPTVITSDTMAADMNRDRMLLMGNVKVDGPKALVNCRRMIVFLQKAAGKEGDSELAGETGGKDLQKIECYDDVVMTRKEKDKDGEIQRSVSGKAVYLVEDSSVTLTEKPVLYKGNKSEVHGSKIVLFTDSDRMLLDDGNIISNDLK